MNQEIAPALPSSGLRVGESSGVMSTISVILCAALLSGCAGLPSLEGRKSSTTVPDTGETRLGKATLPLAHAHPGQSGLLRLANGRDAFAARVRMTELAERSLDVQYYIWRDDLTGTLLFDALRRAAGRGVRVRILLDDNGTRDLDGVLAELVAHANIEVRLFNPFATRGWRPLGYLADFQRLNRRMHNKSFTADNQVTIVGGRNVGDEYFGAGQDLLFVDLDVLAIGPVVDAVSRDFDRYWSSDSSYPAELLLPAALPTSIAAIAADADRIEHSVVASTYADAVAQQPFVHTMLARELTLEWAVTRMVSDDPAKGQGRATDDALLWPQVERFMKPPVQQLDLVSAYFVPGEAGVGYLIGLAKRGVKITVLTNSLEATDVPAVHSGYSKWRPALLAAGVTLLEMKRSSTATSAQGSLLAGSSGSSLHAKTFSVDRAQVFVGSFNFDPRSARLNTELGFVIDSPEMASAVADAVAGRLAERAYRLRLGDAGALQWIEQIDGKEMVHDAEPGTTAWQRARVIIMSMLPIEWLL
jgi:putative cardiolipin synthase